MGADVIIVGAGLAGSAAAWILSRRGCEVLLLEAFQPGHVNGSSHGSARIFRRAYPDPLYVRLTGEARKLWHVLEDEAGEELITITGALDFGATSEPRTMYDLLTAEHVPAEFLTPTQAADRWPGFAFSDDDQVLFHPEGGVIDTERAMAAMRRLAAGRGADIRYGTKVTRIDEDGSVHIEGTVHAQDQVLTAPAVIVAAGAWTGPLLQDQMTLPLTVTQTQAFHFKQTREGPWPTFIYLQPEQVPMYGLPSGSDAPGSVKIGVHGLGTVTTGDDRTGIVDPVVREVTQQFVLKKVPGLEQLPCGELTCLYTSTPSEDFILDRRGNIVVASVCSGHGAKFAPLTGEIAADLATGKQPPHERFTIK
jgi:monomeric sarcosine oxidase